MNEPYWEIIPVHWATEDGSEEWACKVEVLTDDHEEVLQAEFVSSEPLGKAGEMPDTEAIKLINAVIEERHGLD